MRKKILFVTSDDLTRHSAEVIYKMEMCNAFQQEGIITTLCVPKSNLDQSSLFEYYGIEKPFGIIEVAMPGKLLQRIVPGKDLLFSVVVSLKLYKMYKSIIYTRSPWTFFIVTVLFKRFSLLDVHQFRYRGALQTFIYHILVKWSARRDKGKIICISNTLKKQWVKRGIEDSMIFVAHDAVNTSKFNNDISKAEARKKLGLTENLKIVAYTGSLLPGKGVDILIRCANRLPDISFVIVGGKNDYEISNLKRDLKNDNVLFAGHVQPMQVPLYQAAADILVLPNTKGSVIDDVTSPMKLFEYMASERPILATDIPSILEILEHEYNALISPAGDDLKLSENIERIFNDDLLAKRLVRESRKDLENYTWNSRARYLLTLMEPPFSS